MAKYFKIIGFLALISFAIYAVFDLVVIIETFDYLEDVQAAASILIFIIILFVGPATGLLFISYGNHLETHKYLKTNVSSASKQSDLNKIKEEQKPIKTYYQTYQSQPKPSKPRITDGSTVQYEGNNLKIGVLSFNLQLQHCSNISKDDQKVSFDIGSSHFDVQFEKEEKAEDFYNFLLKHK